MAKLDTGTLTTLAAQAGWATDSDINTAVAIAKAESGGNTTAHNTTGADDSYGLMQINMKGSLGPDRRKKYGIGKDTDLFDPALNMRVAYKIWHDNGNSFKPWTTFTSGAYKQYMNDASVVSGVGNALDKVKSGLDVGNAINALGQNVFKAGAGVAGIVVGVVFVLIATLILLRNVVPAGKAAKLAKKAISHGGVA